MRITLSALFIFGLALVLSLPNYAFAQNHSKYMNIKMGGFIPTDDLDDANFDNEFAGEFTYGQYLCPWAAMEVGLGYYKTDMRMTEPGYPGMGLFREENELTVVPLTLTLKGTHTVQKVELYGGMGAGLYFSSIDSRIKVAGARDITIDDKETVVGYHLVVGFLYNLTNEFFLGVEGKKIWTEDAEFKDEAANLSMSTESNLNGYMVTGVIGFRF